MSFPKKLKVKSVLKYSIFVIPSRYTKILMPLYKVLMKSHVKKLHVFLIYVFNMKKFPNKTEEQVSQAAAHKCQASLM